MQATSSNFSLDAEHFRLAHLLDVQLLAHKEEIEVVIISEGRLVEALTCAPLGNLFSSCA